MHRARLFRHRFESGAVSAFTNLTKERPLRKHLTKRSHHLLSRAQIGAVVEKFFTSCAAAKECQQMRGSCSPESMSTTRVPPTRVFIITKPGCIVCHFADDRRFFA